MFIQSQQHDCFLNDLEAEWFAFRFINGKHRTAQQVVSAWQFVGEPTEVQ